MKRAATLLALVASIVACSARSSLNEESDVGSCRPCILTVSPGPKGTYTFTLAECGDTTCDEGTMTQASCEDGAWAPASGVCK